MSNAPYLLDRARSGYRMGHGRILDHMFLDGLEDAYDKGRLMGTFAEDCAQSYAFTREAQDEFALTSLARAQKATADGAFASEIIPLTVKAGKTERQIAHDELPLKATPDKIPHLKPAFREGGTVTAANSSAISDGAAALVLMRRSEADRRGLKPLATIVGACQLRQPARALSHRAHRRHPLARRTHRLVSCGSRLVRNQRGLCRSRDGGHARSRPAAREGQCPRRRLRPRPSHRSLRRAHSRHAARRA